MLTVAVGCFEGSRVGVALEGADVAFVGAMVGGDVAASVGACEGFEGVGESVEGCGVDGCCVEGCGVEGCDVVGCAFVGACEGTADGGCVEVGAGEGASVADVGPALGTAVAVSITVAALVGA